MYTASSRRFFLEGIVHYAAPERHRESAVKGGGDELERDDAHVAERLVKASPHWLRRTFTNALRLGYAIALRPSVQHVDAYPEPRRYFARWIIALHHLLDRCNLEFLCVLFATHTFFVGNPPILRAR